MIKNITLIVLVIASISIYIVTDSKLYYYGRSNLKLVKNHFPLDLSADYWGTDVCYPEMGFLIKDEYGLVAVGKDGILPYDNDTLMIRRILKYGIRKNELVVFIEDTMNSKYYILCSKDTLQSSKKKLEMRVLKNNVEFASSYKWIDLIRDEKSISSLIMLRAYSILTLVIAIFVTILLRFTMKKKRN